MSALLENQDPTPESRSSSKKILIPLAIAAIAAAVDAACDYSFNEDGPTRAIVVEVRDQYALLVGDEAAVKRKWIPRLAEKTVEVASSSEFFTPEEKALFAGRLAERKDEEGLRQLIADIDVVATKFLSSEVSKGLPPGFHSDRDAALYKALLNELFAKYPQLLRVFKLASAAEGFDYLRGNTQDDNPFRQSAKEVVKRCEEAMAQ